MYTKTRQSDNAHLLFFTPSFNVVCHSEQGHKFNYSYFEKRERVIRVQVRQNNMLNNKGCPYLLFHALSPCPGVNSKEEMNLQIYLYVSITMHVCIHKTRHTVLHG